jgi:hypothetical protein
LRRRAHDALARLEQGEYDEFAHDAREDIDGWRLVTRPRWTILAPRVNERARSAP